MPEPIVQFQNVYFRYDAAEALHDVSFTLNRGEIVGLLGPNGAGKTTSIKIVAGMLAANSGAVSVCGLPLPEQAIGVKQRVGYVPESAMLFESLTGQEFLELCGRLHDVEEAVVTTVPMNSRRRSRISPMSGELRGQTG